MADTDNTPLSPNELNAKVQEYHKFKETVLLRDLKVLETKRVQLVDDLKELTQLEENVAELVKVCAGDPPPHILDAC